MAQLCHGLVTTMTPWWHNCAKPLAQGFPYEETGRDIVAYTRKEPGFIILKANGVPMKTVDDLEKAMKEARKSPEQGLFITGMFPSGKRAMYAVDLTQE